MLLCPVVIFLFLYPESGDFGKIFHFPLAETGNPIYIITKLEKIK